MTERIDSAIRALFPEDLERVREILTEECGENIPGWKSAGLERLRLAALKLSQGDFQKLQSAIDLAKRDFRDVLIAARFGEADSHRRWRPAHKRRLRSED